MFSNRGTTVCVLDTPLMDEMEYGGTGAKFRHGEELGLFEGK